MPSDPNKPRPALPFLGSRDAFTQRFVLSEVLGPPASKRRRAASAQPQPRRTPPPPPPPTKAEP